jgi:hypothetical protein
MIDRVSLFQGWKDKYVDGYVALAGVFGGAAKAIRSLVSGFISFYEFIQCVHLIF